MAKLRDFEMARNFEKAEAINKSAPSKNVTRFAMDRERLAPVAEINATHIAIRPYEAKWCQKDNISIWVEIYNEVKRMTYDSMT